ncbi:MAG TPA: hypothetical protein VM286_05245 [Candidatus Thermoplasmatota archaeon]|nr:hypothetical protein [Candidatus Thermoplasmatota archaeon]
MAVPAAAPPRMARRIVAIVVGVVWFTVALLGYFAKDFFLYEAFRSLGFLFWLIYTLLGVGLVATIAWSALQPAVSPPPRHLAEEQPRPLNPGQNPILPPTGPTTCFRCQRLLPPWRIPEGTCTVCSPYSTFLRKPKVPSAAMERRRTTLFLLEGLGIALLALAFVSAAYMFPLALGPARPLLASLAFLVFVPLLAGLILWMYARHERHSAAE